MITSETNRTAEVSTDGVVTEFDFGLLIHEGSELDVFYKATGDEYSQLVLDTDYNIVFTEDGGTITTIGTPWAAGTLLMVRNLMFTHTSNWLFNDTHSEDAHQKQFDRAVMRAIELYEHIRRSIKFPIHSNTVDVDMPELVSLNYLRVNADGDGFEFVENVGSVSETVDRQVFGSGDNKWSIGTSGSDLVAQKWDPVAGDWKTAAWTLKGS